MSLPNLNPDYDSEGLPRQPARACRACRRDDRELDEFGLCGACEAIADAKREHLWCHACNSVVEEKVNAVGECADCARL